MKKTYLDTPKDLILFLETMEQTSGCAYTLAWLVLTYGLSLTEITQLKGCNLTDDWLIKRDEKPPLAPCLKLLLYYAPQELLTVSDEQYLISSNLYKKNQSGSSLKSLNRTSVSLILNKALKEFHPEYQAENLRKSYVYFYLKKNHTLVGSSYESMQHRHENIKAFLNLTQEEYQALLTTEMAFHPEVQRLEDKFYRILCMIDTILTDHTHIKHTQSLELLNRCDSMLDSFFQSMENE